MRKLIIGILILSLLMSICVYSHANETWPSYSASTIEEYDRFMNRVDPKTLRCGFISAYDLAPVLGRMDYFVSYNSDLSYYTYDFELLQTTGGYYAEIDVGIEHQWDGYCEDHYKDWPVLDMSCVNGSMDKLLPVYQKQIDDSTDKYIIWRDVFVYIYIDGGLHYIEWENNGVIITLGGRGFDNPGVYSTEYYIGTIIEKLLSINEEEFQEAKAQLLTIGSNRQHPYSDKWNWGKEGHWYECKCGAKEEVFAHIDEDQNYKCDICPYNIPKNASNSPVIKPAQTDDTATQPTAKPTTPATEPTPAAQEPAPPATGMWIGIGAACAVVVAAAAVLLLKKKKRP